MPPLANRRKVLSLSDGGTHLRGGVGSRRLGSGAESVLG